MEASKQHVLLGREGENVLVRDGFGGNQGTEIWGSGSKKKGGNLLPIVPVILSPGKGWKTTV